MDAEAISCSRHGGVLTRQAESGGLSTRAHANVAAILPKISQQIAERTAKNNPRIDLSTAENCLIRREVVSIYQAAIAEALQSKDLSYPRGFSGDPPLLDGLAAFFNSYFDPRVTVEASHLAVAPGAATCLDSLLFNICDVDDGVLVPGPYWNGFDFQFRVRSSVAPILATVPSLAETCSFALMPVLEKAFSGATRPIRALVMTNPHNPLGQCYPQEVLEACVQFCERHDIHYISDEVYALSGFQDRDNVGKPSFISALSLDLDHLGCRRDRVHVIWSTSKDFGSSGIRMGCTVTQNNKSVLVGAALAANTQVSSLTAVATRGLLSHPALPSLILSNAARLQEAYKKITIFLIRHDIEYIPVTSGLYVFAKICPDATTWEEEDVAVRDIAAAGVLVSSGRNYHGPEGAKGWVRITFAVEDADLDEALRKLETVFQDARNKRLALGVNGTS